jgi:hypothetical protein
MAKIDWLDKLPKTILGGMFGLVVGTAAFAIFADIGYATYIPWEEIGTFLGVLCGAILGWNAD